MQVYLKKFLILTLFVFFAGCSIFSSKKENNGTFPGADESRKATDQNQEVVAQEPPSDTGNQTTTETPTTTPPALQCDPLAVTSPDTLQATAGENLSVAIATSGACGYVDCTLADGAPSWLSVSNCTLSGTPVADADLGDHPITVHVRNTRNEGESVDRPLTLSVKDAPKINLFTAPVGTAQDQLPNVYEEGRTDFPATLGFDIFYAKIEGHADSYDVALDNTNLHLENLGNKLYSISPVNGTAATLNQVQISAHDTHGNSVERTFKVDFVANPCDTHLYITVSSIFKNDGGSYSRTPATEIHSDSDTGSNRTDVILGKKYRIVFQAHGAVGPYTWATPVSHVGTNETCPNGGGFGSLFERAGAGICSHEVATTNTNWKETTPADQQTDGVYYQLETTFSFAGKDLPYNYKRDNEIYDQLTVTVTADRCQTNGQPQQAQYSLKHILQPPSDESLGDVKCTQTVQDVGDTGDSSRMFIDFRNKREPPEGFGDPARVALIEYKINDCKNDDKHPCEDAKGITRTYRASTLDQIKDIELIFVDETESDFFCFDDCDYDQADYDLLSLTCSTKYHEFIYGDGPGGRINDDVVNGDYSALDFNDSSADYGYYSLTPPDGRIWLPRVRPDYPDP